MTGDRPLGTRRRHLVLLSAALASDDDGRRDGALDRAAEAVASGVLEQGEVEEALLQSYLFLGYPAALSAMEAWRDRMPEAAPESDPAAEPGDTGAWRERGEEVCRRVYGRAYGRLRRKVRALHPALDRWAVTEGYGKVLGRPGLPLVDRELCVAAVLAVRGREPQLHSHLRGALEAGAPPDTVEAALEVALSAIDGVDREASAREVWRKVRRRARAGEGVEGPADDDGPAGPGAPRV